jgi:hypothetical protein
MRDDKARKVASCSPSRPIQSPTNRFDVERSTSDNVDAFVTAAVSFAWRNSSVLDIEVGRRNPAVVIAGSDLAPGRPSMEDVDSTRAWEIPVGDVVVESDARGRTGGGPIEPLTVRAGFMVVGVGDLITSYAERRCHSRIHPDALFQDSDTRSRRRWLGSLSDLGCVFAGIGEVGDRARCVGWGENT